MKVRYFAPTAVFALPLFLFFTICTNAFAAGFGDISCEQGFAIYNRKNGWYTPEAVYKRMVDNGISKPLSEMTKDDAIAFRDKILSCNPEKNGLFFARPEDFEVDLIWSAIQKAMPLESAYNKNKTVAEMLTNKLNDLESQTVSKSLVYKELTLGFASVIEDAYKYGHGSTGSVVAFYKNYGKTLSARAWAGYDNVVQMWSGDIEQKINQIMSVFNTLMQDARYNSTELILQLHEAIRNLAPLLNEYQASLNRRQALPYIPADRPNHDLDVWGKREALERLSAPIPALEKRLQTQIIAEIRAALAPAYERVKNASLLSDIAPLKALQLNDRSPGVQKETQYSAFISNPQTKDVLQLIGNENNQLYSGVDTFILSEIHKLNSAIGSTVTDICSQAARDACVESTRDLDQKYKDHYLVLPVGDRDLRLQHLVCAAQSKGLYKKFSAGGFFSSAITLELESGTIYFRATRIDLDTLQEVSTSFKGPNAVNMLLATEFVAASGKKQTIAQPGQEMQLLFAQLGRLPRPVECQ